MPSIVLSEKELLEEARQAESREDLDKAISLYKTLARKNDLQSLYYDRLMILYRKQRDFIAELDVLNKGINNFEKYFSSRAKKLLSSHKRQVTRLSKALMKKTGLSQKDGFLPEPLNKWKKRKELVEKKIIQSKKRKAV